MAKTLLNGVNELLKRVGVISGATGELATLTDSAKQHYIDVAVQVINETIEELYETAEQPIPRELAEATITLLTDDRDYALQADLLQIHWPLIDETNGQYIYQWKAGYLSLVEFQHLPATWTGLPLWGCIRPTDGQLYLDRIPTTEENGLIYKYRYDKDVSLSLAADTVPFDDAVFRAMIPAAAQYWNRDQKRDFDQLIFRTNFGRALRLLPTTQRPRTWSRR